MKFDEIDHFVNELFNKPDDNGWHVANIDSVIQNAYEEALWWHNNRISDGGDPRSGLRGLPYVPWDENIDGVAASMGGSTSPLGASVPPWQRHGMSEAQYFSQLNEYRKTGLSCGELLLIAAVVGGLLIFMMIFS